MPAWLQLQPDILTNNMTNLLMTNHNHFLFSTQTNYRLSHPPPSAPVYNNNMAHEGREDLQQPEGEPSSGDEYLHQLGYGFARQAPTLVNALAHRAHMLNNQLSIQFNTQLRAQRRSTSTTSCSANPAHSTTLATSHMYDRSQPRQAQLLHRRQIQRPRQVRLLRQQRRLRELRCHLRRAHNNTTTFFWAQYRNQKQQKAPPQTIIIEAAAGKAPPANLQSPPKYKAAPAEYKAPAPAPAPAPVPAKPTPAPAPAKPTSPKPPPTPQEPWYFTMIDPPPFNTNMFAHNRTLVARYNTFSSCADRNSNSCPT